MAPNNPLPCHGNEKTMNLNSLILTNIQSSPYFKVNLYELKTYHEVIDEIYYKVDHLEPWEKGSRKTAGQTGMCGGVRGVGAGGIVSSSFCLLYKLFTLKLTRKQVLGLCSHTDSPYIRALGFMYIRYTQPPADLWDWYRDFIEDDEEIDVKAGGGHTMLMGEMLRQWMTKLEWYGTLFPRIPVPIQKMMENHLRQYDLEHGTAPPQPIQQQPEEVPQEQDEAENKWGEAERVSRLRESPSGRDSRERKGGSHRSSPPFDIAKEIEREKERQRRRSRSKDRDRHRHRSPDRDRDRDRDRHKKDRKRSGSRERRRSRSRERRRSRDRRSRSRERRRKSASRDRDHKRRSRSRERQKHKHRSRSRDKDKSYHKESSYERDLRKERSRNKELNGE